VKIWGCRKREKKRKNLETAIWGAGVDKGRGEGGEYEEWRGKMRKGEIGEGSESARVGFFGGRKKEKKNWKIKNGEKGRERKKDVKKELKKKNLSRKGAELIGS
jgi:hypothetical protein